MDTCYSDQPLVIRGPSIFLGGPTPRNTNVISWRPEAIRILSDLGFAGTVLIPERREWEIGFDYLNQVEWEFEGLQCAGALMFWIPRDVEHLPGFTTNVEFGRYVGSNRMVYGRPDGCQHNRYLDWLYEKINERTPFKTLAESLEFAVQIAKANYLPLSGRSDG